MTDTAWDLNCDLGEGEPPERTAALIALVDSANIACGGHAGTDASMRHALALAHRHGVHAGAHPGLPDTAGFGRATGPRPSAHALESWLVEQVGRLSALASRVGPELHHVKLHGALYHLTDQHPDLAETYLGTVARHWPRCRIYARAGGRVCREAAAFGLDAWPEVFLDRAYRADGTLVPRNQPDAVIHQVERVAARASALRTGHPWQAEDGSPLHPNGRTACVHGDSPNALSLLAAARSALHPGNRRQGSP